MAVNLSARARNRCTPSRACASAWRRRASRKANRKDLTVFLFDEGTAAGGVFTATASAPRRCRSAASTWRAATSVPW
jgi:hypothetical protein